MSTFRQLPFWADKPSSPLLKREICSHCGHHERARDTQLTNTTTWAVIRLYVLTCRQPERTFFHTSELRLNHNVGGNWARVRHWGLIAAPTPEDIDADDDLETAKGFWRLTVRGKHWLEQKAEVPRSVRLFRNAPIGYCGPMITPWDTSKISFSLQSEVERGYQDWEVL